MESRVRRIVADLGMEIATKRLVRTKYKEELGIAKLTKEENEQVNEIVNRIVDESVLSEQQNDVCNSSTHQENGLSCPNEEPEAEQSCQPDNDFSTNCVDSGDDEKNSSIDRGHQYVSSHSDSDTSIRKSQDPNESKASVDKGQYHSDCEASSEDHQSLENKEGYVSDQFSRTEESPGVPTWKKNARRRMYSAAETRRRVLISDSSDDDDKPKSEAEFVTSSDSETQEFVLCDNSPKRDAELVSSPEKVPFQIADDSGQENNSTSTPKHEKCVGRRKHRLFSISSDSDEQSSWDGNVRKRKEKNVTKRKRKLDNLSHSRPSQKKRNAILSDGSESEVATDSGDIRAKFHIPRTVCQTEKCPSDSVTNLEKKMSDSSDDEVLSTYVGTQCLQHVNNNVRVCLKRLEDDNKTTEVMDKSKHFDVVQRSPQRNRKLVQKEGKQPKENKASKPKNVPPPKELTRLRAICREVGLILRNTLELAGCEDDDDKIERIKQLLKDRGMKGNPNMKKAADLKLQRELEELCVTSNHSPKKSRLRKRRGHDTFDRQDSPSPKKQATFKSLFSNLDSIISIGDSDSE